MIALFPMIPVESPTPVPAQPDGDPAALGLAFLVAVVAAAVMLLHRIGFKRRR